MKRSNVKFGTSWKTFLFKNCKSFSWIALMETTLFRFRPFKLLHSTSQPSTCHPVAPYQLLLMDGCGCQVNNTSSIDIIEQTKSVSYFPLCIPFHPVSTSSMRHSISYISPRSSFSHTRHHPIAICCCFPACN